MQFGSEILITRLHYIFIHKYVSYLKKNNLTFKKFI